jgi:hypothetical protein
VNKVVVTQAMIGICHMAVCCEKEATDDEILAVCNRENPSGTTRGWNSVVRDDKDHPQCNPVVCADDPNRLHVMVAC